MRLNRVFVLLGLFAFYLLFIFEYFPTYQGGGYDREVFRYMGMLIFNGGIPYTDTFDHKPPIIYLVNFMGHFFTEKSSLGVFIILNILGFLSSIFIYRVARRIIVSSSFSFIITLLYIALINTDILLQGGNLTRQVAAYFVVILISINILYEKTRLLLCITGFVLSLIFLTQQNEIIAVIPIIWYVLFKQHKFPFLDWKNLFSDICYFLLGITISGIGMLLLLIYWNNFNDFIDQAFLFNINFYVGSKKTVIEKLLLTLNRLYSMYKPLIILILLSVDYTSLNFKNISKIQFALLISLALQFLSTSLSGRALYHYFLMFVPYAIFISIYAFRNFNSNTSYFIRFIILLIIGQLLFVKFDRLSKIKPSQKPISLSLQIADKANTKGQLYVFNPNYLWLNSDNNITSPSKWIYLDFAFKSSDPDGQIIDDIVKDINKYKTTYILAPPLDEKYKKLDQLIKEKYIALPSQGGGVNVLYQRK